MVPLYETSGGFLTVSADFLIQALEKMAFVLTLVTSSLVSSLLWGLSLVSDLITQVHVCCLQAIQHISPSSVTHLLTSIQNSLIRNFQQQAKLRIHCMSLFGVDPKEGGIEFFYVLELSISFGQSINPWEESLTPHHRLHQFRGSYQLRQSMGWPQLISTTHETLLSPGVLHKTYPPISLNLIWKLKRCINKNNCDF